MSADKISILSYFVSVILLGSVLLALPCSWAGPGSLSFLDSAFTATSAVCVTGLIVVDTALFTRFGQTVIALLIQFGGLGIVTFATLYVAIPRRSVSLVNRGLIKEMYIHEVESNPRHIIRNIIILTLSLELIGFVVLRGCFKASGIEGYSFSAAFHAISAFCNAGFSTFPDSLIGFRGNWVVNITICLLIVLGGLGFVVMQDIGRVFMRAKRRLSYHTKIVLAMSAVLILVGLASFYMLEYDRAYATMSIPEKLLSALFQSITTRTAGFETVAQASLSLPSVAIIIALMFTGGSPGSTAGGIKTTTMFMVIVTAFRGPEHDGSLTYKGGALSAHAVSKALAIMTKALITISLGFILILVLEGDTLPFTDLLFEIVSAFGTVGLSRGATAYLGSLSKLVIILTMFIGRVGLFAMAITRSSTRVERFAQYPHEHLLLG
jgi:trk system potassium uptake protein TrkH